MKYARGEAKDVVVKAYPIRELIGWTEAHEAELERGYALRCRLAEIASEADARHATLIGAHPVLGPAYAEAEQCQAAYDALLAERAAQRQATRSRRVDDILAARLADARAAAKAAIIARRAALAALKDDAAWSAAVKRLGDEHQAAVTAAGKESGVYYDTRNAIIQSYQTARSRMLADRAAGRPAAMAPPPFDGGRFVCLIKARGLPLPVFLSGRSRPVTLAGDRLTMTVATRLDGEPRIITRERAGKIQTVAWRPPGEQLPLTVAIERRRKGEFPPGLDLTVKTVAIVLRRNPHWHPSRPQVRPWGGKVVITATADAGSRAAAAAPGRSPLAINFGWRQIDGGLRVATIRGAAAEVEIALGGSKPPIPGEAAAGFVTLPQEWLADHAAAVALEAERRDAADAMTLPLRALPWATAPALIRERGAALARADTVSPNAFSALVYDWLVSVPGWCPDDLARCEEWRQADNRRRFGAAARRRRFLGRRRNHYRHAALAIAREATIILMDTTDFAALAAIPRGADRAVPDAINLQRMLAAPHELRQAILNAARRLGRPIIAPAAGRRHTWHCHVGDHPLDPGLPSDLRYYCGQCRVWLDQDENYCLNRLRRHLAAPVIPLAAD